MRRAAGLLRSPDFQQVALMNWADRAGIRIGKEGFAGWALFVGSPRHEHDVCRFVIEHRGPGAPPVHIAATYLPRARHPRNRRKEFRQIVSMFCRLTEQTCPQWESA